MRLIQENINLLESNSYLHNSLSKDDFIFPIND